MQILVSILSTSPTIEIHFPVRNIRNVPALAQELHHFTARPRHLRPSGFRLRVLLKPSNLFSLENKIYLPETLLGRAPNREMDPAQFDGLGVLH